MLSKNSIYKVLLVVVFVSLCFVALVDCAWAQTSEANILPAITGAFEEGAARWADKLQEFARIFF